MTCTFVKEAKQCGLYFLSGPVPNYKFYGTYCVKVDSASIKEEEFRDCGRAYSLFIISFLCLVKLKQSLGKYYF